MNKSTRRELEKLHSLCHLALFGTWEAKEPTPFGNGYVFGADLARMAPPERASFDVTMTPDGMAKLKSAIAAMNNQKELDR